MTFIQALAVFGGLLAILSGLALIAGAIVVSATNRTN